MIKVFYDGKCDLSFREINDLSSPTKKKLFFGKNSDIDVMLN